MSKRLSTDLVNPNSASSSGSRKLAKCENSKQNLEDNSTLSNSVCDKSADNDDQDNIIRRRIRTKYRELLSETRSEQACNPSLEDSNLHFECLKHAEELFRKVTTPREASLDSEVIYMCASLGKQKIQSLSTDFVQFQPIEFAEKLVTLLSNGQESCNNDEDEESCLQSNNFCKLGKMCSPLFKRSPHLDFILGSFSVESLPKPSKNPVSRMRKEKEDNKITLPTYVYESEMETTTEEVERVLSVLHHLYERNNNEPLCYFEFVINPNSFSSTIENIFHVSFLVKDQFAEIFLDADRLPCIAPIIKRNDKSDETTTAKSHQFVVAISKSEWKDIITAFHIKAPLIPPKSNKNGCEK